MNKKIILSFLLIFLIALSVSAVSAEDGADVIAIDENVDIIEVDDSADVLSDSPIQPTNNSVEAVQTAMDLANTSGAIVDLSNNPSYDFGASTVNIANSNIIIDGKGTTTISGDGAGSGLFQVTGKNVTIQGIKFIDTNKKNNFTYGGSVNGVGIRFNGANGGVLKDCEFTDFNSAVQVMGTVGLLVENNQFYGGYTTNIANDPTVNVETGSKSLNIYRQSSQITIKDNYFRGPILDAISIAQGSGSNIVENNYFYNNTYSIYFGGASTKGTIVRNNTFENCGKFKADNQYWERLPVISIQKASNDIAFDNNTFIAVENSILIAAEQGNEAHGFPSSLGNINVTNNIVETSNVNNKSAVVLFHVLVREGELNLTAPIKLEGNKLNGATENITWYLQNGNEYPITPTTNTAEAVQKAIDTANPGDVIDLTNFNEYDLGNDTVTVDKDITLKGNGNTVIKGDVTVLKNASVKLDGIKEINFVTPEPTATAFNVSDVTVTAGDSGNLQITLTDASGKAVADKTITVMVNGVSTDLTTGSDGVATFAFKYDAANTYYATILFMGDDYYKSAIGNAKIIVKAKPTPTPTPKPVVKKATKITAKKKTFKAKTKTKKYTITLKAGSAAVKKVKVTLKVKGKTYKATTSAKGKATFKIKNLKKKGKYTAVIKFAGNKNYKASSIKAKITVKK